MQRCQQSLSKSVNVWHMMVGEDTGHSAPYCIQTFLGKWIFAIYEHLCTDFIVIACNYGRIFAKEAINNQDSGIQLPSLLILIIIILFLLLNIISLRSTFAKGEMND